ncbi:MAG TPA: metal-sulfur cluster assembly factor [Acidimicrobiales bacterium]|nr:metal-sulfur cluster assembly factor [Acidimicrobiales bacterium]
MSDASPSAPTDAPASTDDWIREQRHAAVLAALGQVWDPELGLDVVSLGLVYDVRIGAASVDIDMTLTTPGCPVSEQLPAQAQAAVQAALPDVAVSVHVVWEPPWTPERLSPMALEQLGLARRR